jgi:hypothetical protein
MGRTWGPSLCSRGLRWREGGTPWDPTRILSAIQGHAPRTAAEGYGEVTIKTVDFRRDLTQGFH